MEPAFDGARRVPGIEMRHCRNPGTGALRSLEFTDSEGACTEWGIFVHVKYVECDAGDGLEISQLTEAVSQSTCDVGYGVHSLLPLDLPNRLASDSWQMFHSWSDSTLAACEGSVAFLRGAVGLDPVHFGNQQHSHRRFQQIQGRNSGSSCACPGDGRRWKPAQMK